MNKQTEALKLALEALEILGWHPTEEAMDYRDNAIDAIREALAEESSGTEQPKLSDYEPDGMHHNKPHKCKYPKCDYPCPDLPDCRDAEQPVEEYDPDNRTISVYPSEWKAQRKPLTDEQIMEMYNEPRSDAEMLEFARAIEAAHSITGEQK